MLFCVRGESVHIPSTVKENIVIDSGFSLHELRLTILQIQNVRERFRLFCACRDMCLGIRFCIRGKAV